MMIDVAYTLYLLLVTASIVCALVRVLKGPSVADRLNATDVIALCFIGLAIGHGWYRRDPVWLDVAMVAGLVLFVGTCAVSIFLDPKHLAGSEDE